MNLADLTPFQVAGLAAAAAFGWHIASAFIGAVMGAFAVFSIEVLKRAKGENDDNGNGPDASA